jgi:hypothetical protein
MKHFGFYQKLSTKLKGGPGGWDCPCCNPFYCSPRKMKALARRLARRKLRIDLHKEPKDIE